MSGYPLQKRQINATTRQHLTVSFSRLNGTLRLLNTTIRVQCHAHACIFGWLLGDRISETTADIPRNQRPSVFSMLL